VSDEQLVQFCSPTLAGIKTGNLFSCSYTTKDELFTDLRRLNRILQPKGLRILPLKFSGSRVLVYLYRPGDLARDLKAAEALQLLQEAGYRGRTSEQCIAELMRRLKTCDEFPHEIGLFLSYPPEDVRGFMEHRSEAKCTGCWKVYGDADKAQETFRRYKKCTETYSKQLAGGVPITRLAVAV